ncbi:MAG TPA: DUF3299 domain-containing protein [Verrucomicrobiae bacterium]|nr:DUF3299 domain-containing protein [Verrucomicrobiae bacterium]
MKFYTIRQSFVRQVVVLAFVAQITLVLHVAMAGAGDAVDDNSLQGELIEPIGKAPTNSAPMPTGKIQDGDIVGFDQLAGFKVALNNDLLFNTNRPAWADQQVNAMIPERIRAGDGKLVSVDGFMIPLEYGGKKVTRFILAMNQNTCCFGGNPQVHEFIIVSAPVGGATDEMDVPLRVKGVLRVGAFRSNGKLSGIYQLAAQNVEYAPTE